MANIKVGEVKIPDDEDFVYLKKLCENDDEWNFRYEKENIKIWTKGTDRPPYEMLKVNATFDDVSASKLMDVFLDEEFRFEWDKDMVEGFPVCHINTTTDIGYYCTSLPMPLTKRDFVVQRCWKDYGENQDKMIFNFSVNHSKYPPRNGIVRAISNIFIVVIKPITDNSCKMITMNQADPCGYVPSWLINLGIRSYTPQLIKKLHNSALGYEKWKSKNNPTFFPWKNPEQISCPKIDPNDVITSDARILQIALNKNVTNHVNNDDKKHNNNNKEELNT